MATITSFISGQETYEDLPGRVHSVFNFLDFSSTNVSASDVVQALKMPAGALVKDVTIYIDTAEGETATATVGDGSDADGYDASVDLNATAGTVTSSVKGTDAYAVGKLYTVEDTIDIVPANDLDTAKIVVAANYILLDKKTQNSLS